MPEISMDLSSATRQELSRANSGWGRHLCPSLEAKPFGRHFVGGSLHQVFIIRYVPGVSSCLHHRVVAERMLANESQRVRTTVKGTDAPQSSQLFWSNTVLYLTLDFLPSFVYLCVWWMHMYVPMHISVLAEKPEVSSTTSHIIPLRQGPCLAVCLCFSRSAASKPKHSSHLYSYTTRLSPCARTHLVCNVGAGMGTQQAPTTEQPLQSQQQ